MKNVKNKRARFIVATGGGKTLNEFAEIRKGFAIRGFKLQILVAPTISLLQQHEQMFMEHGFFKKEHDNVVDVQFRTGSDTKERDYIDYAKSTHEDDFLDTLKKFAGRNVLVFVTYASEQKLFDIMRKNDIVADVAVWDEFHHCVKQKLDYKQHLLTLPVDYNLFFSASEREGRHISSTDEKLFGKCLANVTYKQLREQGILVPNVVVKVLHVNSSCKSFAMLSVDMKSTFDELEYQETKKKHRVKAISKEEQIEAEKAGINIKNTTLEAAAIIRAVKDMLKVYGKCNMVTFSKNVSTCKVVTSDKNLKDELDGTSLFTVYAGVPDHDRRTIFDEIKLSNNCVLCQHSIVKEGIDITSFNSILFSRDMNVIGTQQALGRVVRAHPDDTKDLAAGKISLNSSKGWRKYEAVVYIIVDDDDMQDYVEYFKAFYKKLRDTGLTAEDIQFDDIIPERDGMNELKGNPDEPIDREIKMNGDILKDLAKAIDLNEIVIDEEKVVFEKVSAMSPRERFTNMFKNV